MESAPNSIRLAGAPADATAIPQYHAGQIFAVWAAAALPMAALGWIGAPALTGRYATACAIAGIAAAVGPADAASRGLWRIAQRANIVH